MPRLILPQEPTRVYLTQRLRLSEFNCTKDTQTSLVTRGEFASHKRGLTTRPNGSHLFPVSLLSTR